MAKFDISHLITWQACDMVKFDTSHLISWQSCDMAKFDISIYSLGSLVTWPSSTPAIQSPGTTSVEHYVLYRIIISRLLLRLQVFANSLYVSNVTQTQTRANVITSACILPMLHFQVPVLTYAYKNRLFLNNWISQMSLIMHVWHVNVLRKYLFILTVVLNISLSLATHAC